jgi:hypothetical protein
MVAKPDRRARSTAELLEMGADLAKRDVRTDHSLHGRRATGYPHQTGKLMLPILAGVPTGSVRSCWNVSASIAKAKAEGRYKSHPAHPSSSKRRDPASVG